MPDREKNLVTINTGIAGLVVAQRLELGFLAWIVARKRAQEIGTTSGVLPDTLSGLGRFLQQKTGMGSRRARRAIEEANGIFLSERIDGRVSIRSNNTVTKFLLDLMEDKIHDNEENDSRRIFAFIRNLLLIKRDYENFITSRISQLRATLIYQLAGSSSYISRKTTAEYLGRTRRFVINCSHKEKNFVTKETAIAFDPYEILKGKKLNPIDISQAFIRAERDARRRGDHLPGNGQLLRPIYKNGKFLIACQIGNRYGYTDNTTVRKAGWLASSLWRSRNMKLSQGSANSFDTAKNKNGLSQLAFRSVTNKLAAYINEVLKRLIEVSGSKLMEFSGAKFINLEKIRYQLVTLNLPYEKKTTS
jgi:hypothetical protein